jgi:RNA polymerase sigma-70 factor (ECF subfamily)
VNDETALTLRPAESASARPVGRALMAPDTPTRAHSSAGIEAAIREFVDQEYGRVVMVVGQATGQFDAAEDAVQDALLKVLADGHRPDRLGAWVTVVAINHLRARRRRAAAEASALDRMDRKPPTDAAGVVTDRVAVLEALDALSNGQRTAVLLHYYLDSTVADIAAALGVTEGTVKTQLHRGRQALAVALGEMEP